MLMVHVSKRLFVLSLSLLQLLSLLCSQIFKLYSMFRFQFIYIAFATFALQIGILYCMLAFLFFQCQSCAHASNDETSHNTRNYYTY